MPVRGGVEFDVRAGNLARPQSEYAKKLSGAPSLSRSLRQGGALGLPYLEDNLGCELHPARTAAAQERIANAHVTGGKEWQERSSRC